MLTPENPYEAAADAYGRASTRVGWRTANFMLATAAAMANLFRWAQFPDDYSNSIHNNTPPFTYPWDDVLRLSAFMLLHATVTYFILRPESYHNSWGRALVAFGVQAFACCLLLPVSMHPSPVLCWFLGWILICTFASLVLCIASSLMKPTDAVPFVVGRRPNETLGR